MEDSIKPPALAGLEGFEPWDRAVHAPENREVNVAFVSVRVGGAVGFNKACYKMWGEPRMVHAEAAHVEDGRACGLHAHHQLLQGRQVRQ
ncbi:MAG: hypothetical protein CYG60_09345, partial [Actinobacteria bacterium]